MKKKDDYWVEWKVEVLAEDLFEVVGSGVTAIPLTTTSSKRHRSQYPLPVEPELFGSVRNLILKLLILSGKSSDRNTLVLSGELVNNNVT